MQIVETDNHGSDYPDERFIAEGIPSEAMAKAMCAALNAEFCPDDRCSRFYKVVPFGYVLQPGFEP